MGYETKAVSPVGRRGCCYALSVRALFLLAILIPIDSGYTASDAPDIHRKCDILIPASDVATALTSLAKQADISLLFPYQDAKSRQANPVNGRYTILETLSILLQGTGLSGSFTREGAIKIEVAAPRNEKIEDWSTIGERRMLKSHLKVAAASGSLVVAMMQSTAGHAQGANEQEMQQASADVGRHVDEIIVTARKREEALIDVPAAVSLVDASKLFSQRMNTLSDVTKAIPNVNLAFNSSSNARMSIRGVGSDSRGGTGPGAGFFIDGAYQTSSGQFNTPLFDLQRVEVLKGPQGALYGRNTLIGVINFITPKPGNDFEASSMAEYGNYDSYRAAAAAGGPLVADKLFLRVSYQHAESQGPWKYDVTGNDVAPSDFDAVRGRLVYRLTERLEFDATASYYDLRGVHNPVTQVPELQHLQERFVVNEPNKARDHAPSYNLRGAYDLDSFEIISRTSYTRWDNEQHIDIDFGPANLAYFNQRLTEKFFEEELRIQNSGDHAFNWLVGAAYAKFKRYGDNDFSGAVFSAVPAGYVSASENKGESDIWSGFAHLTYDLADALELGAAVRYDALDTTTSAFSFLRGPTIIPLALRVPSPLKEKVWQPSFTVRYKFSQDFSAFATAAKGFRQGGFNTQSVGTIYERYTGDVLWSYEAGVKWRDIGEGASANLSVFYIDWKNANGGGILPTLAGPPAGGNTSLGSARSYGIEGELTYRFNDYWNAALSGGLVDCEYTRIKPTATPGLVEGTHCIDSSEWTLRGDVGFEQPIGQGDVHFTADASISGRGPTRISVAPDNQRFRDTQDRYFLVDASVGVKTDRWQVIGYVNNLFDREYAITVFFKESLGAYGATNDSALLGMPRTYGVRVKYSY